MKVVAALRHLNINRLKSFIRHLTFVISHSLRLILAGLKAYESPDGDVLTDFGNQLI